MDLRAIGIIAILMLVVGTFFGVVVDGINEFSETCFGAVLNFNETGCAKMTRTYYFSELKSVCIFNTTNASLENPICEQTNYTVNGATICCENAENKSGYVHYCFDYQIIKTLIIVAYLLLFILIIIKLFAVI